MPLQIDDEGVQEQSIKDFNRTSSIAITRKNSIGITKVLPDTPKSPSSSSSSSHPETISSPRTKIRTSSAPSFAKARSRPSTKSSSLERCESRQSESSDVSSDGLQDGERKEEEGKGSIALARATHIGRPREFSHFMMKSSSALMLQPT